MTVTKGDILRAIHGVTGDPSTGVVRDITPGIVDAIDALLNPPTEAASYKPVKETRVVVAEETR
jgi:hypothetical protein